MSERRRNGKSYLSMWTTCGKRELGITKRNESDACLGVQWSLSFRGERSRRHTSEKTNLPYFLIRSLVLEKRSLSVCQRFNIS